ncbi:MAG: NAD-dependent epimerase/dehydratase family protein, partial [Deltaproteobacteria bacterium]|nr:NAD-dependent epimerase/dehydratase family protein [Deltaproteobacteria bacterium]
RALVLPAENVEGVLPASVEIARADITDAAAVSAAMRGAGSVFHLAAVVGDWGEDDLFQRVTVGGTRNVMNAAADNDTRVLLASSVVVYGDSVHTKVCNEDLPYGNALGPYSRTKQQQEQLAWEIARARDVKLTVVRPTNVYGPGSRPWVHDVVDQLKTGTPSLIGGGEINAGLAHVDNVVDIFVRAACTDAAIGRAYNASDGSDVTWRQYFSDIARLIGAKPPASIPWIAAKLGAYACETTWRLLGLERRPPITHEALNLVGSDHRVPIERARRELGYTPLVDYAAGIRSVAEYLKQAHLA